MKGYEQKKKKKKGPRQGFGFRTSKEHMRNFNRTSDKGHSSARPRASFGGHQ